MTETYPPGARLPALTRLASDALCAAYAAREPGLLGNLTREATTAYGAARALPVPGLASAVDGIWRKLVARHHSTRGQPGALRTAMQARDTMAAIVALPPAQRDAIADKLHLAPAQAAPARRAAMLSHPVLAEWQAVEDAEAARLDAIQAAAAAERNAEYERQRPAAWLAAFRKRGVAVELDGDRVMVPASAVLTDAERAEAAAIRPALVALLRAEADAAAAARARVAL